MTTATRPAATLDVLGSLLESEQNSIFRFMDEGSPYLNHATAEIRGPLHEMVRAGQRRAERLASMIDALGGAISPRGIQLEEQYLAFLSIKFLLPKLLEAKKLAVERYDNAIRALTVGSAEVKSLLTDLRAEHQSDLKILQRAAADLSSQK